MTTKDTSERFRGVAMITAVPFDQRRAFDTREYWRLSEHQIKARVHIAQCPLAEEIYYFSDDECADAMKTLADATKGSGACSCVIASHSPTIAKIIDNV